MLLAFFPSRQDCRDRGTEKSKCATDGRTAEEPFSSDAEQKKKHVVVQYTVGLLIVIDDNGMKTKTNNLKEYFVSTPPPPHIHHRLPTFTI